MFLPVSPPFFFMCRHDWSTPSNSICRTELWNCFSHFKAPSAFYNHFPRYLRASAASTLKCKPLLRIHVVFWSHKSFLLQNIYACILYIHSIYSFFFLSLTCVLHKWLRWEALIALWRKHIVSLGYLEVVNHPLDHVRCEGSEWYE